MHALFTHLLEHHRDVERHHRNRRACLSHH
ncbi:Uncharacterised protein [Vibrio cholerae]|nr:Uncharacterised protein [Vibrio cholerae]